MCGCVCQWDLQQEEGKTRRWERGGGPMWVTLIIASASYYFRVASILDPVAPIHGLAGTVPGTRTSLEGVSTV